MTLAEKIKKLSKARNNKFLAKIADLEKKIELKGDGIQFDGFINVQGNYGVI